VEPRIHLAAATPEVVLRPEAVTIPAAMVRMKDNELRDV
jgi:hypothetical protein